MKQLIAAGVLAATAGTALAECNETQVDLRGDWGTARFAVEIADSPEERAMGLMNRPEMARNAGMLFFYESERPVAFWMENTLIPLDMIFMSADGVVQNIHENAVPLDRTLIPGGENILAVLEINGGMSALLGINPGSQLRHPGLDQANAAWPCEGE